MPQSQTLLWAAAVAAFLAALYCGFAPVYSNDETLAEANGGYVWALVTGLFALAALPAVLPPRFRRNAATGIGVFLVLFSFVSAIGVPFLLSALLLMAAGAFWR